ncbi:MAG: mannosyltransferase, partial [Ginsengibacter sp.]
MNDKHLHIVCLDVPYPPDYGGVFDLFYKIRSLHSIGINIHLHCFEYGRGKQEELKKYCKSVSYYKRKNFLNGLSLRLPFIVSSRANRVLLNNLLKDDHPVLLEGIHCSYFLYSGELKNRKIIIRLHNVE